MKTTRRSWITTIGVGIVSMFRGSNAVATNATAQDWIDYTSHDDILGMIDTLENLEDADDDEPIAATSSHRRVVVMCRREGDAGCYQIEWDEIKAGDYLQIMEWCGNILFEQFACIARSVPIPELPGCPCQMELIQLDDFWRRPKCVFRYPNGTIFSPPDYLTTRQHGRT